MGENFKFAFRYPQVEASREGETFKYHPNLRPVVWDQVHSMVSIQKSKVDNQTRMLATTRIGKFPIIAVVGEKYSSILKSWIMQSSFLASLGLIIIFMAYFMGKKLMEFSDTILRQQEEIVSSARFEALGEMAGSIAHEINNPMTIIAGNIRKINKLLVSKEVNLEAYTTPFETILRAMDRISSVIVGLKNLSRNKKIESEPTSVEKIVSDAILFCNERLNYNNIDLRVKHENPNACVFVDGQQITQVLISLIDNSADAVAKLEEKWININTIISGNVVTMIVTDSGRGISNQVASQMMEPFYTTKPINQGSGLGLSVSKRIIRGYNGRLYYKPNATNTTFVVELPLYQNSEKNEG